MASIEKLKLENGEVRYKVWYRDGENKLKGKRCKTKAEAEKFKTSVQHAVYSHTYVEPSKGKATFKDYAQQWTERQIQHRRQTAASIERNLRTHAYPAFGDRPMGLIVESEILRWIKTMQTTLAPGTVRLNYVYVAAIFAAAVKDKVIPASPCAGVKRPKLEKKLIVPLSTEQVDGLIANIEDRYKALLIVGATTGLRQGEAFGLCVDRVDFLRRTIRVDQQIVQVESEPPEFGPLKTDASYRTVPVSQVTIDAIAAHLAKFGPGENGLIFTASNGAMLRRTLRAWRPASLKIGGLPKGTGFHALRHFYASMLIEAGESVKVVQARLGHSTPMETLNTYAHMWPDNEESTRLAVDAGLGSFSAKWSKAVGE